MLSVKDAARTAIGYLQDFYPGIQATQVEEVELGDDEPYWYITLSYLESGSVPIAGLDNKTYKVFRIHSVSGEVVAMKIRQV